MYFIDNMAKYSLEIEKRVGWYPRPVSWPFNMRQVESASEEQLLEWYRFLPSAKDEVQAKMISRIIEILFREGGGHGER
jgi:hypothetical protein